MTAGVLPAPTDWDPWWKTGKKILSFIPHLLWASGEQKLTVNGGSNYDLSADSNFTAFDKTKKITVCLQGDFTATSTSNYAVEIGDLSTWAEVEIIIESGCRIVGRGGNGGNSSNGSGGAGGTALNVNSANSSSILTITNNGTIAGGGGGGGGGARYTVTSYTCSGGKGTVCNTSSFTLYRGGGGGGGGAGSGSGGSRTTSSANKCGSGYAHGVAGSAGSISAAGGGGSRGYTRRCYDAVGCGCDTGTYYGGSGGSGGAWGTGGNNGTTGSGGAAGKWCDNRDHASWPSGYGTTHGGYTA